MPASGACLTHPTSGQCCGVHGRTAVVLECATHLMMCCLCLGPDIPPGCS